MSTESVYKVPRDPIFLVTALLFVPLTTVLPALMGQVRLMSMMQTAALIIFMAIALRHGDIHQTLVVMTIWVVTQLLILALLGAFLPAQVELAIPDGFALRTGLVEWVYTAMLPPASLQVNPGVRLLEIIAIMGGTLLTGGLVGVWILVRTVNQVGFSIGVLLGGVDDVLFMVALLPWTLLRIAGYTGLVALLAEPLWSRNWSGVFYVKKRKRLLLITLTLLLASLVLEAILPEIWPGFFQ